MMNVCLCGTQPGYPHEAFCPFPYYGNDWRKVAEWERQHQELVAAETRRWDEYSPSAPHSSDRWATTARGWLFAGNQSRGFYLDYGDQHHRSPHEYCRGECHCRLSQPGNILAVINDGASRYVETVEQAKKFVEDGVCPVG
jgi:hypothetical protein